MITQIAIFQILVFLLYVGMVYKRYGVIHSISQSWYELPRRHKWMFTMFLWTLAISTAMYGGYLFYISAVGFGFVGAATMFSNDKTTQLTHYAGAGIGILFAYLGTLIHMEIKWAIVIYALVILAELVYRKKHVIWWIEIWAFLFLMLAFLTY